DVRRRTPGPRSRDLDGGPGHARPCPGGGRPRMTVVLVAVSAMLAVVAAAGVLHPFRRRGAPSVEPLADDMGEERAGLLRNLKELDEERATGLLGEAEYRALRTDTERRAVAVLRALEARGGAGALDDGLGELRDRRAVARAAADGDGARAAADGDGARAAGRRRRGRVATALVV